MAPGAKLTDNELFQTASSSPASRPRARSPACPAAASAWTWSSARSRTARHHRYRQHGRPGSEITLRLPLTLAIIDGLLVRVGRGRYVIPLSAVEECVELSTQEDARSRGRNFLNIRGDLVPFLRLRELFNARRRPTATRKS